MRTTLRTVLAGAVLAIAACNGDSNGPSPIWLGFEDAVVHTVSANQAALAVADVNKDGHADIITLDTLANLGARLFMGSAGGSYTALGSINLGDARELFVADVSRDGTPDILGKGATDLYVAWGGSQGPGAAQEYPMPLEAGTFAVGDLDGDGINDVSVILNSNFYQLGMRLLVPRASDGKLEPTFDYTSQMVAAGRRTCVADVTGEGHADVVIATTSDQAPVLVLPNKGGITFEAPVPVGAGLLVPGDSVRLACADFDGDGRQDVALLREGPVSSLTILMGTAQAVKIGAHIAIGSGSDVAVGDVDQDGRVDVLVASAAEGGALLVKNMGGGYFMEPAVILSGNEPSWITLRDLTGDGYPEIVLLAANGKLAVMRNGGR